MEAALKCNPQNAEMAKKARELKKLRDLSKQHPRRDKENQEKNKPVSKDSSNIKTQGSNKVCSDDMDKLVSVINLIKESAIW